MGQFMKHQLQMTIDLPGVPDNYLKSRQIADALKEYADEVQGGNVDQIGQWVSKSGVVIEWIFLDYESINAKSEIPQVSESTVLKNKTTG